MAIDKVRKYFEEYGMADRILEFDVSSKTVELAAVAVGCEPARIAKSMSFLIDETPIIIVAAGDAKIANPLYKEEFHTKAKMVPFESVGEIIGHEAGGVCPFAVNDGVVVYLDESLKRFETVFPAAGSGNSAIELTIAELEQYSGYKKWINVCKDWE